MRLSRPLRSVLLAVVIVCLVALVAGGVRILDDPEDLRAFYCAGQTVAAHADPYLAEPLRTCEVRESIADGLAPYRELAVPAPLPGFALAPFVLASLLPLAKVTSLFALLVMAAFGATVLVLAKLVRVPLAGVAGALILCDAVLSLVNGQIFPFALLALCGCALQVRREEYGWASVCAAFAGIEPHVALPAWLCLALTVPAMRRPLAIAGVALCAVSIATLGIHENVEYLARVLPAHARSEASATAQYSLTTFLNRAGAPLSLAVAIGNLSYVITSALGIAVARRLAARFEAPEFLALVPPAFALFGGPFLHLTQVAAAVPALLLLIDRMPERRAPFAIALLAIALPWEHLAENTIVAMSIGIVLVSAIVATWVWRLRPVHAAAVVAAALALGLFEHWLRANFAAPHVDATSAIALADGGSELAEATWRAFITATENNGAPLYVLSRLPTWAALALTIATATYAALPRAIARVREDGAN